MLSIRQRPPRGREYLRGGVFLDDFYYRMSPVVSHAIAFTFLIGASLIGASCASEAGTELSHHISSSGGEADEKVTIIVPTADVCPGYFKVCVVEDSTAWKPQSERTLERGSNELSGHELLYFLADKAISDEQLAALKSVKRVGAVSLTLCTSVTDKGLKTIAEMPELRYVNLSFCDAITDDGVKLISELTGLWKVSLCGCRQITDIGAVWLGTLGKLKCVDLSFAKISATSIKAFSKAATLEELILQGCDGLDNSVVDEILKLKGLSTLNIGYSSWAKDDVLLRLAGLDRLRILSLDGCPKLTDEGLNTLDQFKLIEELSLVDLAQLTTATMRHLLGKLNNLQRFDVSGCDKISEAEIEALKKSYPKVTITN